MNIRPKNYKEIIKAVGGTKLNPEYENDKNSWRNLVFNNYRLTLLDILKLENDSGLSTFGYKINNMLDKHSWLYNNAKSSNFYNLAYENLNVSDYLNRYKNLLYGIPNIKNNDFNLLGIKFAGNLYNRYIPSGDSGDNEIKGYIPDGYYSAITDDRRILGRIEDWDENSLNEFNKELEKSNWRMEASNDGYYRLKRLILLNKNESPLMAKNPNMKYIEIGNPEVSIKANPDKSSEPVIDNSSIILNGEYSPVDKIDEVVVKKGSKIPVGSDDKKNKSKFSFSKILGAFNNPNILAAARFAGNLANNEKVYNEQLKALKPILKSSYHTGSQVYGDEGLKQLYYRRAILGLSKASLPITSDLDKLMSYLFELKRIGDDLRAQGDIIDNNEIKRTTELSNLHQWANALRDSEVANANVESIARTNAAKHNLLALKHSALWTSIDLFLQGLEYNLLKKKEELKALADNIFALELYDEYYDEDYYKAKKLYLDDIKKYTDSEGNIIDSEKYHEAKLAWNKFLNAKNLNRLRKLLEHNASPFFAKSGAKITYKKKDDLLYKLSKDAVEHFRKMSKLSSDVLNRKTPKIEKLTSHPKGKTNKYLLGGVAPFTIYRPVALGGETTTNLQRDTSSTTKSEKNSTLDIIKDLFKNFEGLPSDTNKVFNSLQNLLSDYLLFGNEISPEDLASMYLLQMQNISKVKYYKELFDKAQEVVNKKDASSEFAVDTVGNLIVLNKETGKVESKSWSEVKNNLGKYNPLRNDLLLNLRANSPSLAFSQDFLQIANNATSMQEIAKFLKDNAIKLGSTELEGYTKHLVGLIKAGLELLTEAPTGDYTVTTKDLKLLVAMALKYLKNILPNNMKTLLQVNSELNGNSMDLTIAFMLGASIDESIKFNAVTGKAASKDSDSGSKGGLEMNNALKLLTGAGEGHLETFGIGNNNVFLAIGRQSTIADTSDSEKPFGADFSYNKIYESGIGRILDLDNASFGDVPINKTMKDSIIVDNSRIVSVDLPYTNTRDGRIIPDFKLLNRILEADEEILRQNLNPNKESDINKINRIYADKKLPIKYNSANLLSGNYMKFAVILATAVEDVFLNKDGLETNATLTLVTDDNEKDKYIRLMSEITKDKKYSLSKSGIFSWGDKDIYKGSIFIPINGDIIDASLAGGASKVKTGMSDDYDTMRKAWQVRNYLEVPQVNFGK